MSKDFFADVKEDIQTKDFFADVPLPKEEQKPKDFFDQKDYGLRQDKTKKGMGYFGELKTPDNKAMTELSIGVNIDDKEIEIPTLVPTLTGDEVDYLRRGGEPNKGIIDKAVDHARLRISQGKNPFAEEGEQQEAPEKSSFWDTFGQAGAYQARSAEFNKNILPQGQETKPTLEQFGIRSDVSPFRQVIETLTGESPKEKAFQSLIKKKPLELILAPLRGHLSMIEDSFGGIKTPRGDRILPPNASEAWREKAMQGLSEEEINELNEYEFLSTVIPSLVKGTLPKKQSTLDKYRELTKPKPPPNPIQQKLEKIQRVLESPTATKNEQVAAQRAIDRLTGKYDVETGLEKIAKSKGITKDNVLQRVWDRVKKWSKDTFGKELTPTNITPEESLKFIEYVEQEEKAIPVKKPVEKVKPTNIKDVKPTEVQKPTEPKVISKPKAIEPSIRSQLPELQTDFSKEQLQKQKDYLLNKVDELIKNPVEGDKVTVKVPGDGLFKINNNKENLIEFKYRVNKLWPTKPFKEGFTGKPTKALRVRPQKARDKAELKAKLDYEKTFVEYGNEQLPIYRRKRTTGQIKITSDEFTKKMQDEYEGVIRKAYNEGKITLETANEDAKKIIADFVKTTFPIKDYIESEKPLSSKPVPAKWGPVPPKITQRKQPVIGKKQAAKRSDIIKLFRKAFTDPIRLGKFKQRATGIHKMWSKVTRLLNDNDVETAAHEIGHNLHTTLFGGDAKTPKGQRENVVKALKPYLDELKKVARYEPFTLEGFAEFNRMYVTNPDAAQQVLPKFYQKFEDTLDIQYPELKEALLEAREYYDRYLQGTPRSRVTAQIAYPEKTNLLMNAGEWAKKPAKFDRIKTLMLDDLYPIKRVVAEVFGIKPVEVETLFAKENLYVAMRNLKASVGRADIFATHETYDYKTLKKTGEGYKQIIKELKNDVDYKEFNDFLVARRSIEKGSQGIQTGINQGDAVITYNELKAKWKPLAKRWDGFWDRTLRYVRDSGLISDEQFKAIKDNNLYYAPFQRDMGKVDKSIISGKGSQAKNPIKRMKGSTRDIIPPVEAGLKNIYSMVINAEKNKVGNVLAKLANKKNAGMYVEAVPTPTTLKGKISKEEVEKQLIKHFRGIAKGKDLAKIENMVTELAELFPDSFTRFGATHYPAGENIVTVFNEGNPKYYEVSPELYESWIRGTSPYVMDLVTKLLRVPARMLRAGAILNPKFMVNNVVRDTWERALFTKFGDITKDPVGVVVDTVYRPLSMLMQAIGKQALYIEWMKAGGGMSTMQGSSRDSIVKHMDEIRKGFPIQRPLRVLRELAAWGEETNRIAEFVTGKKAYPNTREGKEMAAFQSRDVSIDFLKTGLLTKALNAIIPFFNVGLQGPDKLIRMMVNPKTRSRAILRLISGVTIPSMILWWLNKEDKDIKELPDTTRDRNFVFKIRDKIYKIPVPFESGILAHGLTQRMMDYMMLRDPDALKGFMGTIVDASTPNIIPTLGLPFMETIANKNFFTGKRIIPFNQEQLISRYQYKTNTSLLARETGRILSYILGPDTKRKVASPAIIDHFINAWGGGLGRIATNIIDAGLEKFGLGDKIPKPEMPVTQKFGLDAFVVRHPHSGAKSIERFYDNYKDFISRKKSYQYADKMEADTEENIDQGYERIDKIYDEGTLKQAYNAMKMCQKEINGIFLAPEIDSKTKKEMIDDLYDEMIAFAKEANDDIKKHRLDVKNKK